LITKKQNDYKLIIFRSFIVSQAHGCHPKSLSRVVFLFGDATAYGYIVNGKSAIEWIMERYAVTTHKDSGITNNPNDWARENRNPRYIIDLLHSVINLSVQTVEIVKNLPDVEFGSEENE